MVTLFLRQGETGKQVLLSFPATTTEDEPACGSLREINLARREKELGH